MAVRLRQLYQSIENKEDIVLVAGEAGLDHIVRWVHMVEGLDISLFLEGDEVAFTTGIALGNESDLLPLAEYIQKQNAAGMVINIGPYIKEIPQEVIDFGNEHDFPIFQVPWRVYMAHIMREFTRQINLDDFNNMELGMAFSNAIFQSENTKLYLPVLQKNGYKTGWSYCVATLTFYDENSEKLGSGDLTKYVRYAEQEFCVHGKHAFVYENEGTMFCIFVNQNESDIAAQIENYLAGIHRYFNQAISVYVGIGECAGGAEKIAKSYRRADQIRRLQYRRGHKNEVLNSEEFGVYRLLLTLGEEELSNFFDDTLGDLKRYDQTNEADYLHFLREYFKCDCSTQAVAEQFHLHRNSVTYKLHKIEEIIGMSLGLNQNRVKIVLALMAEELL